MGKLLIFAKYVFLVFSSDLFEKRKHVHVRDGSKITKLCKFWIEPKIELVYNNGFTKKELNEIEKLIEKYLSALQQQLDKFYKGDKIKAMKIIKPNEK